MKTAKILLSGLLIASLISCKKEKQEEIKPDSDASEDIAMSMSFDEEINNIGQMSLEGDLSGKNPPPG